MIFVVYSLPETVQPVTLHVLCTGCSEEIRAILITRIVDGKIKEDWLNTDFLGLMQQLGVAPAPA